MFFFVGLFTVVFMMGLTGCGPKGNEANVEIIQDMMEQPALKAQDFIPQHRDKTSMLVPPDGTAAMNREVYLYKGNVEGAANNLKNPYTGTTDEKILALGKIHFNNYCFVCHGEKGLGDGPVASKFQGIKPPSLMTDKVRNFKDGQIFHIITDGQGVMGAYINQMPWSKDRWAVVAYVRKLQSETK
ncbi:MAG: cytochrome c [Bdellovibrionaceae bacterium]|nr:cytochrome c [Pseudobdellovibrionaceae bacterium]